MNWLTWLLLATVVAVIAAVTGLKPKGTKPVARTHLMSAARVILAIVVIALLVLAWHARRG